MDDADLTAEREERHAELVRRFRRPAQTMVPTGLCLNCDELVGDGQLFCDAPCRDDWQRRERIRKLKGNVEI